MRIACRPFLVSLLVVIPSCSPGFSDGDSGLDAGVDARRDARTDSRLPPGPDPRVIPGENANLLLRGVVVTPAQVIPQGEVLTAQDTIVCVAASCATAPEAKGATIVDTAGIIFPGLIDAHNHTQYNYLPLWKHSKLYTNHGQWQASAEYSAFTKPHRDLEGTLICEMIKYGEIRSLTAGTTTIQGTPLRKCADTLIRNADLPYNGLSGGDTMRTNVLGIDTVTSAAAQTLIADFESGKVKSYLIHLSEGIDETARKEFDQLEALDLLRPQVSIIHGTALKQAELTKMSQAGMSLVWSPSSNLDLYNQTNDIAVAWQLKIPLAISPDWTPSGEPNVLAELRVVERIGHEKGDLWSAKDLVRMATDVAASALKLDDELGTLKPGMRADLLVIPVLQTDAYQALVGAGLADVRLVMVRGRALYGDPRLMTKLAPNAYCESIQICGSSKVICVKESESDTNKLNQSLGDIETALADGYTPGILGLSTCD